MIKNDYFNYFVKVDDKVKLALKIAEKDIENEWIPFDELKKACKTNIHNKFVPIYTQHIWFCINRNKIRRYYPSGRVQKTKVCFAPVYIEPSQEIINKIKEAIYLCPEPKIKTFSYLSNRTYVSIWEYLNGKCNIPLTIVLKACNILDIDVWGVLDNYKMYTRDKKNYITFKKDFGFEMEVIKTWIKLEGTISLSGSDIIITQSMAGKDSLIELQRKIAKNFKSEVSTKLTICETRPGMNILNIFSAPLRQILVLRYNIPLGYKSRKLKSELKLDKLSKKELVKLVVADFETEGSFVIRKKTKYHTNYCEFSFSCYSEQYSRGVQRKLVLLDFEPSFEERSRKRRTVENEYRVILRKYNQLIRLCFEMLPYLRHKKKIGKIFRGLSEENYISKCRINKSMILSKMLLDTKHKFGTYKKMAEFVFTNTRIKKDIDTIRDWVIGKYDVPLIVVWSVCELMNENWKKFIPEYFSILLWLNNLITTENMRNIYNLSKEEFEYFENIKNKLDIYARPQ